MNATIKILNYDTNGYLVKIGDTCILIDCPVDCEPWMIADVNPQAILHTHVQAEHCGEWLAAPDIPVYVPKGSEELSTISSRYLSDSNTQ
jgi:glyoxylase-like metal-dependent hydrolase (beta-lactamase superfamily II)